MKGYLINRIIIKLLVKLGFVFSMSVINYLIKNNQLWMVRMSWIEMQLNRFKLAISFSLLKITTTWFESQTILVIRLFWENKVVNLTRPVIACGLSIISSLIWICLPLLQTILCLNRQKLFTIKNLSQRNNHLQLIKSFTVLNKNKVSFS